MTELTEPLRRLEGQTAQTGPWPCTTIAALRPGGPAIRCKCSNSFAVNWWYADEAVVFWCWTDVRFSTLEQRQIRDELCLRRTVATTQVFTGSCHSQADNYEAKQHTRDCHKHTLPAYLRHVEKRVGVELTETCADQDVRRVDDRPGEPQRNITPAQAWLWPKENPPQAGQDRHEGVRSVVGPKLQAAERNQMGQKRMVKYSHQNDGKADRFDEPGRQIERPSAIQVIMMRVMVFVSRVKYCDM